MAQGSKFSNVVQLPDIMMKCKQEEWYFVSEVETYVWFVCSLELILDFKCEVRYHTQHRSENVAYSKH